MFNEFIFSADMLILIAGTVISVLFSYIPHLNTWYASQSEEYKKLFMLGVLVLVTGSIYAMGCYEILNVQNFVCGRESLLEFVGVLLYTIATNQGVYKITPQTEAVKLAKVKG